MTRQNLVILSGRANAILVGLEIAQEVSYKVDFFTKEDGLLAITLETKNGDAPVLTDEQINLLASVGLRYEPEYNEEYTDSIEAVIMGYFGD